jgi:hypothetical protein
LSKVQVDSTKKLNPHQKNDRNQRKKPATPQIKISVAKKNKRRMLQNQKGKWKVWLCFSQTIKKCREIGLFRAQSSRRKR